jgi:hypothetical protein
LFESLKKTEIVPEYITKLIFQIYMVSLFKLDTCFLKLVKHTIKVRDTAMIPPLTTIDIEVLYSFLGQVHDLLEGLEHDFNLSDRMS